MILWGCIIPILWVRKLSTGELSNSLKMTQLKTEPGTIYWNPKWTLLFTLNSSAVLTHWSPLEPLLLVTPGAGVTGVSCGTGVESKVYTVSPKCPPFPCNWKLKISGRSASREDV